MVLKQFVVFDANRVDIPFAYYIVQASFQSWCPQTSAPLYRALVPSLICTLEFRGGGGVVRKGRGLGFQISRPYPQINCFKEVWILVFFQSSPSGYKCSWGPELLVKRIC